MDFSHIARTADDVELRPHASAADTFELIHRSSSLGNCRIEVRDDTVARLHWDLGDGSINAHATAMRTLVNALYVDSSASRIEVVIDHHDRHETQVAMRTGLRREGIMRGGLQRCGALLDGALFASLASDPTPQDAGGFTYMLDSVMPLKRLISHVVMTDPGGRILLCRTTFKKDWELPGGIVEPGEAPALAGQREVAEEIGLELPVSRLLAVDWLPPYLGWSDAIELLYDGGEHPVDLPQRLEYDTREILEAQWFSIEEITGVVSPLNARRLPLLVPNRPAGTLHLENGSLTR
ncbi:MAG: NUDIX domain-containing protein [Cumulibacter sp.]